MVSAYILFRTGLLLVMGSTALGLLCGRDCKNVCLHNTCQKFLYECKYGCKGGNQTACDLNTTPTSPSKDSNTGIIAGATGGAFGGVVVVGLVVVALVILQRKHTSREQLPSNSDQTFSNPAAKFDNESDYSALEI